MKISVSLAVAFLLACILTCDAGMDWRLTFIPIDPWRAVDGQTNYVKLDGVEFCGKIVDVTAQGIRIEGEWGKLGSLYYPANGWAFTSVPPEYPDYFVTNWPYVAFPGETIPSSKRLMAWTTDGTYTYKTVRGDSRTIRELDYGVPCGPNPVLLAAIQKHIQDEQEQKHEREARQVEFLERDATNGDSSAQYSLGIHYLHGIGCETNEVKGLFWLIKSAAQGNIDASNDLQEIEGESAPEPESISTNRVSIH
jgi:Sel1 repeat